MKRIGPELKMPKLRGGEMKVPPFLSDLYADLRDRRLLPLVALILVAIVAAPVLLAGDPPEPEPVPAPVVGGSAPAAQSLTVVKAEPGLRNYKKRLAHRSPTNPFKQRFAGSPSLKGAQLNSVPPPSSTNPNRPRPPRLRPRAGVALRAGPVPEGGRPPTKSRRAGPSTPSR
jgi:hypothetical protein